MEMPNMKKVMILTVASLLTAFVFTGCDDAKTRQSKKQLEEAREAMREQEKIEQELKKKMQGTNDELRKIQKRDEERRRDNRMRDGKWY